MGSLIESVLQMIDGANLRKSEGVPKFERRCRDDEMQSALALGPGQRGDWRL
jgi:hypothetical protein